MVTLKNHNKSIVFIHAVQGDSNVTKLDFQTFLHSKNTSINQEALCWKLFTLPNHLQKSVNITISLVYNPSLSSLWGSKVISTSVEQEPCTCVRMLVRLGKTKAWEPVGAWNPGIYCPENKQFAPWNMRSWKTHVPFLLKMVPLKKGHLANLRGVIFLLWKGLSYRISKPPT